jgi:hypothetical protein
MTGSLVGAISAQNLLVGADSISAKHDVLFTGLSHTIISMVTVIVFFIQINRQVLIEKTPGTNYMLSCSILFLLSIFWILFETLSQLASYEVVSTPFELVPVQQ